jgi:chemotaxis protein histidine kinase CheA
MYPPSHSTSPPPAPAERKKTPEVKEPPPPPPPDDTSKKEIESLRELIKKHEEERVARENAIIAKAEADKAAAAAEKKKQEEIAAAKAAAKAEAEKAADEVAKKAKEESDQKLKDAEDAFKKAKDESDKKLADAQQAKEAEEKKKKELEEEIKKNKPLPDMLKEPIKFKDAVGRKFSFPWHLCKTWKGMENLIKQAFLHVDMIGQHVQEGHYDLTGPDGEIILPQVWDTMIKPNWEISMHMWPMPEPEKLSKRDRLAEDAAAAVMQDRSDPFAGLGPDELLSMDAGRPAGPAPKHPVKKNSTKKGGKRNSAVIDVPPMHSHGPIPPPNFPPNLDALLSNYATGPMAPPGVVVVGGEDKKKGKPKPKSKDMGPLAAWIAGSSSRSSKKDDEKHELVRHRSAASSSTAGSATHKSGVVDQAACAVM